MIKWEKDDCRTFLDWYYVFEAIQNDYLQTIELKRTNHRTKIRDFFLLELS